MNIIPLNPKNTVFIDQVAYMLNRGFYNAWLSIDEARREVMDSFDAGRISLVAIDAAGDALGWIGGRPQYGGNVWELHPLVVDEKHRHCGIGSALVCRLEQEAAARGGITMILGADDENNGTSLGGVDIYQDTYNKIECITNLPGHPYEFYMKLGYRIMGVVPDANGWGKPDILMAKRITK